MGVGLTYLTADKTMSDAHDAQVYAWADIYSPPPSSPSAVPSSASSGETSSYSPSDFTGSPSGTTSSLASSPPPSRRHNHASRAQSQPQVASEIDLVALHDHLPALYAAYQDNPEATEVLRVIINLVIKWLQPDNSLINALIVCDAQEHRCSVNTCPRYSQGSGWSRLDRAREHFRNEHLGSYFPCTSPGCESRYRRRSDLRAHLKSHGNEVPSFGCRYCTKSYSKRCNLNRHMEVGHRMRAPRRVRRAARH